MRAGRRDRKASFYSKSSTRGDYNESTDVWTTKAFDARGSVQYAGGDAILSNEEKFYSGVIFFTMRYRSDVVETMRLLIDDIWYRITYLEEIGRKVDLKLSLSKINE
jgi:head-tail adaptor